MNGDELFTSSRMLIPKLSDFVWSQVNYEADGISLSNNQCNLILQMLAHPERSMSELGMGAKIKKSTMTGIVNSLENEKILVRKADENDKRRIVLTLTELGYKIGYTLRKKNKTAFLDKKNMLSESDQLELELGIKNLNKIMDKLKELTDGKN
jgi:DNA-binding MarR family transcriptional regulator